MAITKTGVFDDSKQASDGALSIGNNGSGTLTVDASDLNNVLTLDDPDGSESPSLGIGSGNLGIGYVLVTGAGSKITLNQTEAAPLPLNPNGPGNGPTINIGRNGGTGVLVISDGGSVDVITTGANTSAGMNVGRGVGSSIGMADGGTLLLQNNASLRLEGFSSNLRLGRDGGTGSAVIDQSSVVNIIANGTTANNDGANLRIGSGTTTAGGFGSVYVGHDSTMNIHADTAAANLRIGGDLIDNPDPTTANPNPPPDQPFPAGGELVVEDALVHVKGLQARAQIGTVAGSNAAVVIKSGGEIRVEDTAGTGPDAGFIGIGSVAGVARAEVSVDGDGSVLKAINGNIGERHRQLLRPQRRGGALRRDWCRQRQAANCRERHLR